VRWGLGEHGPEEPLVCDAADPPVLIEEHVEVAWPFRGFGSRTASRKSITGLAPQSPVWLELLSGEPHRSLVDCFDMPDESPFSFEGQAKHGFAVVEESRETPEEEYPAHPPRIQPDTLSCRSPSDFRIRFS
jgi:hypothetical protein